MRKLSIVAAIVAAAFVVPAAASAQERAQVGAFGGLTFGNTTSATTFGGSISAPFASNIQIIAEGGRLDNVMPSLVGTLLDFTPVDVRLSAWYGEGGVRFLASRYSAITPYAEATAGFARLRTRFTGGGRVDPFVNTALRVFDRNEPLLGTGAGVILRGGPIAVDFGYRYKKIFASNSLQSLLTTGNGINVSEARIGIGIRF